MEKIDESLVLLADLMCWPLKKVASLLINGRQIDKRVSFYRISFQFVQILFAESNLRKGFCPPPKKKIIIEEANDHINDSASPSSIFLLFFT